MHVLCFVSYSTILQVQILKFSYKMSDEIFPVAQLTNKTTDIHLKPLEGDILIDNSIHEVQHDLCTAKIATEHIDETANIQFDDTDIKGSFHPGRALNNSEDIHVNHGHGAMYEVNREFPDKGKAIRPICGAKHNPSNILGNVPVNSLSINKLADIVENNIPIIKQDYICVKRTMKETSSIQSSENVPVDDDLSLNICEVIYENCMDSSILKVKQEIPDITETTIQSTVADIPVDVSSKGLEEIHDSSFTGNNYTNKIDDVIMVIDKDGTKDIKISVHHGLALNNSEDIDENHVHDSIYEVNQKFFDDEGKATEPINVTKDIRSNTLVDIPVGDSLSFNKPIGIDENLVHKAKQELLCVKRTVNEMSNIQSLENDALLDSRLLSNNSKAMNENRMDYNSIKVKQEFPDLMETTQSTGADVPINVSSQVLKEIHGNAVNNYINEVVDSQLEVNDVIIIDKDEFINNSTKNKTGCNVDTSPIQRWTPAFKNFVEIYSESDEDIDEMCIRHLVEAEIPLIAKNGNSLATKDADKVNVHNYRETLLDSASDSECDSSSSVSDSSSDLTSAVESNLSDGEIEKPAPKKCPAPHITKKKKITSDYEDLPQIHQLEISLDEKAELLLLGSVSAIIDTKVVILSDANTPALNLDSVVFLENREPLGQIFDVFGRVENPRYVVLLASTEDVEKQGIACGSKIYYAPEVKEVTNYVFVNHLRQEKGSDASWEQDKEPPEKYLDFSDDEKEKQAKAKRRNKVDENGIIITNGTKRRRKEFKDRRNLVENEGEVVPVFDSASQFSEAMIATTSQAVSRVQWNQRSYPLQASRFQSNASFESNLSRGFRHNSPRGFGLSFPAQNIHQFGHPPQFRSSVPPQTPPTFLNNPMVRPRYFPFLPQRFSNSTSDMGFRPSPPYFQSPRFSSIFGSPRPAEHQGFNDESYSPFGQSTLHHS